MSRLPAASRLYLHGPWGHSGYQRGVPETGDTARILCGYAEPPRLPPPMYFHRFCDIDRADPTDLAARLAAQEPVFITAEFPRKIFLLKKDKTFRVDTPPVWVGKNLTTELIFNLWVEYFPLTRSEMQFGLWSQFIIRVIGDQWNIHCSVIGMGENPPDPDWIIGVQDGHIPPYLDTRLVRPHTLQGQTFSFEENYRRNEQYQRSFYPVADLGPEDSEWDYERERNERNQLNQRRYSPY